jgi:uncharacterized damage-inducible protein DinB
LGNPTPVGQHLRYSRPGRITVRSRREKADADIEAWAARLEPSWLDGNLAWFSQAAGRELQWNRGRLVVHFFNHQTHHRGQVHAMLTALGQEPGDTDLPLVIPRG